MKTLVIAIITSLSLTTLASGTVKGTNFFPGYGEVSSDKVCLTENSVKANLPAHTVKKCIKYSSPLLGHVCEKYESIQKDAMSLEAPLSLEREVCLVTKRVFDDSLVPKDVCVRKGMVTYNQPRKYIVATTVKTDVFHDDIVFTEYDIPACN